MFTALIILIWALIIVSFVGLMAEDNSEVAKTFGSILMVMVLALAIITLVERYIA